jgi:hypothetical protein
VSSLLALLRSPVGPSLVFVVGAVALGVAGRWVRRPALLTGLALGCAALAGVIWVDLRFQGVVPTFSRSWRPLFQNGANLTWVGDGWNWYISGLLLLLGSLGLLLDLNGRTGAAPRLPRSGLSLALHLAVLGAGLLFVNSGTILTIVFTWVLLDLLILVRGAVQPQPANTAGVRRTLHPRGLSLAGALLLLMALLPAGPTGPNQPLQGGVLPVETVVLLLGAGLLRAGIYPLHFWLLPEEGDTPRVSERLLNQMVPVLTGMWLLGWTISLGGKSVLAAPEVLVLLTLSLLAGAFIALSARSQASHANFVLIAAASSGVLAGALFYSDANPAAMLWPATTFALGGGLWLVGERVWQGWGWQLPVSVGALTLAGAPFTPGFLMQASFASLLQDGLPQLLLFLVFALAQSFLVGAVLRSWSGAGRPDAPTLQPGDIARLMVASIALAIPLALAGFLPGTLSVIAGIPGAIPPLLGSPPSVVAELPVWVALALPLALGFALVFWLLPRLPAGVQTGMDQVSRVLRMDWLFTGLGWGTGRLSSHVGTVIGAIEGAGYFGWMLVFVLLAFLLTR